MLRSAGYCDVQHSHGQGAVAAHQPVQQSRRSETIRHMWVTGPSFGSGVLSSFRSGRVVSSLAIRRTRGAFPQALMASLVRPFHDLGSYFADRSHAVGARAFLRQPFFQRQHLLVSSLRAPRHHVILSSSFTRWIKKYQQARTNNWEIQTSFRRAI